jgi:hypothetical protein
VGQLAEFVNSLADDADKERLFEIEPVAVMMKEGLSEADQRLILKGTTKQIRDRLQEDLEGDQNAVAFVILMIPPWG